MSSPVRDFRTIANNLGRSVEHKRAALERAHGGEECIGPEECAVCSGDAARAYLARPPAADAPVSNIFVGGDERAYGRNMIVDGCVVRRHGDGILFRPGRYGEAAIQAVIEPNGEKVIDLNAIQSRHLTTWGCVFQGTDVGIEVVTKDPEKDALRDSIFTTGNDGGIEIGEELARRYGPGEPPPPPGVGVRNPEVVGLQCRELAGCLGSSAVADTLALAADLLLAPAAAAPDAEALAEEVLLDVSHDELCRDKRRKLYGKRKGPEDGEWLDHCSCGALSAAQETAKQFLALGRELAEAEETHQGMALAINRERAANKQNLRAWELARARAEKAEAGLEAEVSVRKGAEARNARQALDIARLDDANRQRHAELAKTETQRDYERKARQSETNRADEAGAALAGCRGGHRESCDVFQLAPDLGPSQKPCNCRTPVAAAPDASSISRVLHRDVAP